MLYHYAVDPETLFAKNGLWNHHAAFGIASGRVIADVGGENWRQMAQQHLSAIYHEIGTQGLRKMDEWLCNLAKSGTYRRRHLDVGLPESGDWISTVRTANQRSPFRAIVSNSGERFLNAENVISKAAVDLGDERWNVQRGVTIKRQVQSIASALTPLAQISQDLLFVEPFFAKRTEAFGAIAKIIADAENAVYPLRHVEVHTELKDGQTQASGIQSIRDSFPMLFRKYKNSMNMPRLKVLFRKRLHDRFLLTELGGIKLSAGFDEAKKPDQDADLLTGQQWLHRWIEYNTREIDYIANDKRRESLCGTVDFEFEVDCKTPSRALS
jgi:hypothetical protein